MIEKRSFRTTIEAVDSGRVCRIRVLYALDLSAKTYRQRVYVVILDVEMEMSAGAT